MADIKKLFVSEEFANKFKILGFDEACIAYYTPAYHWMTNKEPMIRGHFVNEFKQYFNSKLKPENVAAPTYQQAVDFLMEEHLIFVSVVCQQWLHTFVGEIEDAESVIHTVETNDYYEALDMAIDKAIEIAYLAKKDE